MKNLFEPDVLEAVKARVGQLQPDSAPLWGKMNVAQAVAHCSAGLEMASGERKPPQKFMGRLIGRIIKPMVLGNDEPMRRNSPTMIAVEDDRNLEPERRRLCSLIDRFAASGPQGCTNHPHSFFGRLTPMEWAILMYKHLDHHLRQFGV
jgi:Protein of unknown function (DUF1569)